MTKKLCAAYGTCGTYWVRPESFGDVEFVLTTMTVIVIRPV